MIKLFSFQKQKNGISKNLVYSNPWRFSLVQKLLPSIVASLGLLPIQAIAASYPQPNPWTTNQIPVCFDNSDKNDSALSYSTDGTRTKERHNLMKWNKPLREKLMNLINSEYSKQKTHVEFVNWQSCDKNDPEMTYAHIFISTSNARKLRRASEYGRSSIGMNFQYPSHVEKDPFVYLQHPRAVSEDFKFKKRDGNSENYWEAIALHEFGHLAGLFHEHEHAEISKDPNCVKEFGNDLNLVLQDASRVSYISIDDYTDDSIAVSANNVRIQHGSYDPKSIMNYCFINLFKERFSNEKIRLSPQDIDTLREMYSEFK